MNNRDYLADPCGASSLPFWKAEGTVVPEGVRILREDAFSGCGDGERDEPYFKLLHELKTVPEAPLPEGYAVVPCGAKALVRHIDSCYTREHLSLDELAAFAALPVFRPELLLAVADAAGGLAASGLAALDERIGEGTLEWVQVSAAHRRRGLGSFIICELLRRLRGQARFVTVSGRLNSESDPLALYTSCGFTHPVIWHVLRRTKN